MENRNKKFIIDSQKSMDFSLVKERVPNPETDGKDYAFVYSKARTRSIYSVILSSLPRWKGAVIIYGENDTLLKPVDCIWSENNLREHFREGLKTTARGDKVSRFAWMEELLLSGQFKKLKVFTTTTF